MPCCSSVMTDIEHPGAAAMRGTIWLQSQVATLIQEQAGGLTTRDEVSPHARRSRHPEHFAPGPSSRAQRHPRCHLWTRRSRWRSGHKHQPGGTGWSPRVCRSSGGGDMGHNGVLSLSHAAGVGGGNDPPTSPVPSRGDPAGEEQQYSSRAILRCGQWLGGPIGD